MSKRERGFTLVELLVSLAILAVALAVLFGAISNSLDRTRKERADALAASLVQSLLARAGTERQLANAQGAYSNGYRWQLIVQPRGNGDDAKATHMQAYTVQAVVTWQDGAQTHAKSLSALHLVPIPPAQP